MASITSATTTNRALLQKQQVTLNTIATQNGDVEELMKQLIEAIKEITNR